MFSKKLKDLPASQLPPQTFFLLGPTAVGKSELAVRLAEKVGGEIVGADAYQVYKGFDILSAKPGPALLSRVRHHMIGEIDPREAFDVATFRSMALDHIRQIAARGAVPIICGGAGLYARALTHGISDELPGASAALREELESNSLESLVSQLLERDPQTSVDLKNRRRVVRALEVCILTGRPFSSFRDEWDDSTKVRGVILSRSRESLLARIEQRTRVMFDEGVIEEVAAGSETGPTASQMLGLRELRALISGKISRKACLEAIIVATRQYAKRQMTWFRRERGYTWMDLDVSQDAAERLVTLVESSG